MAERKTIVYPNPEVLAQAVAARTLLTIIDLLAEPDRQRVDIAVTGGTDGIYVLKVMGESPLADAVDWRRVHVWWGDERFVAADDDDRNAKQAREAWFGKLIEDGLMPAGNIHERSRPLPQNRRMPCWLPLPRNTSGSLSSSWAASRRLTSRCSAWVRTRISRPCSPTMAKSKSTIRMCWWPACVIRRNRRRCV